MILPLEGATVPANRSYHMYDWNLKVKLETRPQLLLSQLILKKYSLYLKNI